MFVGIIAMLFFTYMAGIILDTVDVIFVCFAIDKDNGVDVSNTEIGMLMGEMEQFNGPLVEAKFVQGRAVTAEEIRSGAVTMAPDSGGLLNFNKR
jgi:hypothetical protein